MIFRSAACSSSDRKSTRLNSSHTVIYTLSLHDALPICLCSTLITVTVQKSREIGLMKALGANDLQVCCVFLFHGTVVGVVGAVSGTILGLAILRYLNVIRDFLLYAFHIQVFS